MVLVAVLAVVASVPTAPGTAASSDSARMFSPAEVLQEAISNRTVNGVSRTVVVGGGASFPNRLYNDVMFAYQFKQPDALVTYASLGSGAGLCRIRNYTAECGQTDKARPTLLDFAGSDNPLDDAAYVKYPDLQFYPAVAGAVVPVYNLPKLPANYTLVLRPVTLARIFRRCAAGNGTLAVPWCQGANASDVPYRWDHPDIVASNPSVAAELAASGEILVSVRADNSGTSGIFKAALSKFEPAFQAQIGSSTSNSNYSAVVSKHKNNEGVVGHVLTTPGAIGYSVLGEALAVGLPFASLLMVGSSAEGAVGASTASVGNAVVERGLVFSEPKARLISDITGAVGVQAWPIAGYTYFVVRKSTLRPGATCANVRATLKFFTWFYSDPVSTATALAQGFAPLPDAVRQLVVDRLRADLQCAGRAVYVPEGLVRRKVRMVGLGPLSGVLSMYLRSFLVTQPNALFEELPSSSVGAAAAVGAVADGSADIAVALGSELRSGTAAAAARLGSGAPLLALPFTGLAFGVVANMCESSAEPSCSTPALVMDATTLAKVLRREITQWSDPALTALNPALAGRDSPIEVIGVAGDDPLRVSFEAAIGAAIEDAGFAVRPSLLLDNAREQLSSIAARANSIGVAAVVSSDTLLLQSAYVALRWPDAEAPVLPTPAAIAACAAGGDALDAATGVVDLKRAAAGARPAGCYPLVESVNLVTRRSFSGALSCSEGQGAGETTAKFLGLTLSNVLLPADSAATAAAEFPLFSQGLVPLAAASRAARAAAKAELLGITCEGVSILAPPEDRTLVPKGLVLTLLALTGVFVVFCALLGVWTWTNRKRMIVLIASPPFLAQILVGAVLMSLATVPLLMQDDGLLLPREADGAHSGLDAACAVAPLTYSVGFALMYSSLWLKTWRLEKIFNNPKLKKVYITNQRMQAYSAGFLLVVIVCNALWVANDPLHWERVATTVVDGKVLTSVGHCTCNEPWKWASPLMAVILLALLYGLRQVFNSRSIPSEYGEASYITMSLITSFEAIIVGVPLLLIDTNPSARLIIFFAIITATAAATVGFIFVPKMVWVGRNGWSSRDGTSSGSSSNDSKNKIDVLKPRGSYARKPHLTDLDLKTSEIDDSSGNGISFADHFKNKAASYADEDNSRKDDGAV